MRLPAKATTAVLLFALPDSVEAGRKTVARQSGGVWRAMRKLTQAKVHASGLPLLNSNRLINHAGTFGQQMSAALAAAFAQGYEHILCIGNDCPDLSIADLRRASRALADGEMPIGADRRGGVYMAGFSREQFDAPALTQLPWQTNHLADALRQYVSRWDVAIDELPVRADVNVGVDALAVRWVGQVASRWLMVVRQVLLAATRLPFFFAPIRSVSLRLAPVCGRAPPFYV